MFSLTYHGEVSSTDILQDMGDDRGGISVVSGGNKVRDDLHMETTGNCCAVGSVATNI